MENSTQLHRANDHPGQLGDHPGQQGDHPGQQLTSQ